jgi:integrase
MRIDRFSQRFVINAADGAYTDGSGLWLDVRNGGKSKSWAFRFGGKRISPPGGSAHKISVEQAQAFVRQCRDQLARGEDPFTARVQAKQAESEAKITFRYCVAEYYKQKCDQDWGAKQSHALGRTIVRNYLDPAPFADLPVRDITTAHIETILKPYWLKRPEIAKRTAHFLNGMFRWLKAKKWYVGENPAAVTRDSALRLVLGRQPRPAHREALPVEDVPKLVAHLRTPRYPRSLRHGPDVCTVREAMEATGAGREGINRAIRLGKLPGAYKPPGQDWKQAPYLIPIAELKKLIPLRNPIREVAEISMHAYILQFVIFTVVRSDMACHLRWDDINEKRALIEYRDRHKSGHHSDRQYNVVITDGVAEILDAMRTRRQRERLDSEYVFVQGSAPMGINARLNQPTGPSPVNAYLERALEWIGDTGNKNASVHGFRTTFPTWACDLNDYPYELVKATLGHAVGRQQVDAAYFRNVKYLDQRRKMMAHWERHCLSFCDKPQQEKVVPLARRTERNLSNA